MSRSEAKTVRVRMYCQGLGDCFLLTFPGPSSRPKHMLIDCGVLLGTEDGADRLRAVAEDIERVTNGKLDVLVATHEHWDHLSGFLQAQEVFDRVRIGEVWFAWTEDPRDDLARELREKRERAHMALARALSLAEETENSSGHEILGLFGARRRMKTGDALVYLKEHPSQPHLRYLEPGERVTLPGLRTGRAYVLGPPRDLHMLGKSDPTKRGKEVYELSEGSPLWAAVRTLVDEVEDWYPFDDHHRLSMEEAMEHDLYWKTYGTPSGRKEGWRRINAGWGGLAERLALALDGDTNNTSLALAFELEAQGRVLLFPADAQVGNWLSWKELSWKSRRRGGEAITSEDLLARTILYKVGHHASHNATLRADGLERMTSPDLVAMIPVSEETAKKRRWKMPFPALLDRLRERTRGRVLRADQSVPEPPEGASKREWKRFTDRVEEGPDRLYLEWTTG